MRAKPVAQFSIIPFMESGAGKEAFGWLLGEGNARGIALTFLLSGIFMLLLSLLAFRTKAYHRLSESFRKSK
jgi:DHA3 family multidrug efflux protein-like MFS transporter